MVHRHTPLASAFRGYSAGGARAMIDSVDDGKQMQESNNAQGMKGESWASMESPQNYGFTSLCADADKGENGSISDCAEGFVSFMGGNRSFPVMGVMDDRRHRLKNIGSKSNGGGERKGVKGSSAMYGLKEWGHQNLITESGSYFTGNTSKKMRTQLVGNSNAQQQGGQQGGMQQGGGQQGGQQKSRGQEDLHGEESSIFTEHTGDHIHTKHGDGQQYVTGDISQIYHQDPKHDTRCDGNHVHIGFDDSKIWVDKDNCWSSKPIVIRNCTDGQGGPSGASASASTSGGSARDPSTRDVVHGPILSGPPAYYTSAPLTIDASARLSIAVIDPIKIVQPTVPPPDITPDPPLPNGALGLKYEIPLDLDPANGDLMLRYKAPLFVDPADNKLTTTGGMAALPIPPTDGYYYAMYNGAWVRLDPIFAKIDSPSLTGSPQTPNPPTFANWNDYTIANTAFVTSMIPHALVDEVAALRAEVAALRAELRGR